MTLRNILKSTWFIHLNVFLGLLALFGYIMTDLNFLLFFVALSFAGAVCGSFIKVIVPTQLA